MADHQPTSSSQSRSLDLSGIVVMGNQPPLVRLRDGGGDFLDAANSTIVEVARKVELLVRRRPRPRAGSQTGIDSPAEFVADWW